MRKFYLTILILGILFLSTKLFASPGDVSSEEVLNRVYDSATQVLRVIIIP